MFYDRFYDLCQKAGVTPTQVSRDLGMRQSTVSMWKKQGTTPKYETAKKLADYFGVSVDYLLGKKDLKEDDDIESVINKIADEYKLSRLEREIIEKFLELDEPARSSLLGYAERLAEESRNKPPEPAAPMDIKTQLEMCRRAMLTGIAVAQANYSIRPEDVDIDSITLTPELSSMIENELETQRRILEEEQRKE